MRTLIHLLASTVILTSCTSAPNPQASLKTSSNLKPIDETIAVEVLTQGHTKFAIDLYKKLSEDPDKAGENIFISPLSVSTAFGLAYAGAKGETAQEMASVLHYILPEEQLHPTMGTLIKTVEDDTEGQLFQMANALFVNQDTVLEPDYLALTKASYEAEDTRVDFKNQPKQAIETINDWVKDRTHGLIPKTLSYTKDTRKTRNVMVNTAYLKTGWAHPFSDNNTKLGNFATPNGNLKTPLMQRTYRTGKLFYTKGRGHAAVSIPYQMGTMSMIAILPDKESGLPKLEAKLSPEFLLDLRESFANDTKYEVELTLPKIDLSDDYKLQDNLKAMGMSLAFSDFADFSGRINSAKQPDNYPTKLGKVVHKTVLKMDEDGTEAAAVTAIDEVIIVGAPRKKPKKVEFKADHPFLLLIQNNKTGAILFMGRINNPVAE